MNGMKLSLVLAILLANLVVKAQAEAIINESIDNTQHFHSRLDGFSRSLSEVGPRMEADYERTSQQNLQRHQVDQRSIEEGTHEVSRQAYRATQRQAAAAVGGSFYNGSPSPLGIGGLGVNGFGINRFYFQSGIIGHPHATGVLPSQYDNGRVSTNAGGVPVNEAGVAESSNDVHSSPAYGMPSSKQDKTTDPYSEFLLPLGESTAY